MNTSAAIADPLLRQASGRRARSSDPHRVSKFGITEGLFRSPRLITSANGPHEVRFVPHRVLTAPHAGLATRLSDFATNRHEYCGLWLHLFNDLREIPRIQHDLDSTVLRPARLCVVAGHRPGICKANRLKTLPTHATAVDEESHNIRGTRGG